jgi:hypothetical protein
MASFIKKVDQQFFSIVFRTALRVQAEYVYGKKILYIQFSILFFLVYGPGTGLSYDEVNLSAGGGSGIAPADNTER